MADGSTDASETEKELVYVHFVNEITGEVQSISFALLMLSMLQHKA